VPHEGETTVKIGLMLPLFSGDTDRVLSFARRAEELGFDGLFAFDHMFPPGAPPDRPSIEAFSTLGAVAAVTHEPRIGTLVTRASLRSAGLLAKLVATVDAASGGRMIVGIGAGDPVNAAEHVTFGLPVLETDERRAQLAETVDALHALFRGDRWEGGTHVPALAGPLLPPPVTEGGPPIWLGGASDAAVRLAAEHADAWNGWGLDTDRFARKAAMLREAAGASGRTVEATWGGIVVVGRDRDEAGELMRDRERKGLPTNVWSGTTASLREWLDGLEGAGATWTVLGPGGPRQFEAVAAELHRSKA
jgi:alkanesulfonate monooxygenase SsuD/methylene tetrahydromethanopterin reductase-like flavin-dependent oxidoreductase (luciferase family)